MAMQWLFWQVGGLGPMVGQRHHFERFAEEKIPYAIDRYVRETQRLIGVLDQRLENHAFICGAQYTIADMASYPWVVAYASAGRPRWVSERAALARRDRGAAGDPARLCAWRENQPIGPETHGRGAAASFRARQGGVALPSPLAGEMKAVSVRGTGTFGIPRCRVRGDNRRIQGDSDARPALHRRAGDQRACDGRKTHDRTHLQRSRPQRSEPARAQDRAGRQPRRRSCAVATTIRTSSICGCSTSRRARRAGSSIRPRSATAPELSDAEKARRERERIAQLRGIVSYRWSPDAKKILFGVGERLWLYDLRCEARRRVARADADRPRRHRCAGVAERALRLVRQHARISTRSISTAGLNYQLTRDGKGPIHNGEAEFVAQEEMDRATGYWWAPDDSQIAFERYDESRRRRDQAQRGLRRPHRNGRPALSRGRTAERGGAARPRASARGARALDRSRQSAGKAPTSTSRASTGCPMRARSTFQREMRDQQHARSRRRRRRRACIERTLLERDAARPGSTCTTTCASSSTTTRSSGRPNRAATSISTSSASTASGVAR